MEAEEEALYDALYTNYTTNSLDTTITSIHSTFTCDTYVPLPSDSKYPHDMCFLEAEDDSDTGSTISSDDENIDYITIGILCERK
jgi:hypothetical protein